MPGLFDPIPIHAYNPGPITGPGNWTWLLPGRVTTLIDAGQGDPRHLDEVEQALAGRPLSQVLVTHGHTDHASGAPALRERFPGVRMFKMPWPERDARSGIAWQPLADADRVPAGDTSLVAIHTPGHAPDHLCFFEEDTRTLFCGDLAWKGATVWIPSSASGDLIDYLDSLRRILALAPARMMPAHGEVIDDPEPVLQKYLDHRAQREQEILDALRHGVTTPQAMVARIYTSLKENLRPMAAESVTAHLLKLQRDGRARRIGEEWQLVD